MGRRFRPMLFSLDSKLNNLHIYLLHIYLTLSLGNEHHCYIIYYLLKLMFYMSANNQEPQLACSHIKNDGGIMSGFLGRVD